MSMADESSIVKQGSLKKQGGFLNSIWQNRSFALTTAGKLLYSNAASALWEAATSGEENGCITLSASSAAVAAPAKPTDFTLTNVAYAHKASEKSSIDLRRVNLKCNINYRSYIL